MHRVHHIHDTRVCRYYSHRSPGLDRRGVSTFHQVQAAGVRAAGVRTQDGETKRIGIQ